MSHITRRDQTLAGPAFKRVSPPMRIKHKIFFGYLALIAVAVALVVFFVITLSNFNRRYADLIGRDQQTLLLANNIRSSIQRQIVAARTYEQIGDISLQIEYSDAVHQQQQAIQAITPLLTDEQDRKTLGEIESDSQAYTRLAQEAMDMSRSANPDQTLLTLKRVQGETARLSLVNTTDSFIAKKNQQVLDTQAELRTNVDEISTQLLLWLLVGVIGAIIAASLLTEGFTAPLRRLMRNIQGISSGDLETAIASRSRDEVGELASVLETMRQRLSAAVTEKQSLLDSAREEAEKLAQVREELEIANGELQQTLEVESEARRRIEEIDRLKSEFTSMISHELKTPISYVYNYAGALKEHNNSLNESQRSEFLTAIQGEAHHLLALIDDIMAISLLEGGGLSHRFVRTDLRKLVDSVVRDHQLTTRRHTITVKGPDSLIVRADPTRFKQVMNNLLSNAIKYSPQGGAIEVRLRANRASKTAIIYVRDHGLGIDPADTPKLFDRFTRIQRKETMAIPGSGLGLFIAHHIIEAHGGTLNLQPAPGKGTIAEVTMPLIITTGGEVSEPEGEEIEAESPQPPEQQDEQPTGIAGNGNGRSKLDELGVEVIDIKKKQKELAL